MKKKSHLFIFIFLFSGSIDSNAQCSIDSTQTVPGVYPDSLPDAVAGQFYTSDITFVLKTDTLGLSITNYHITNVTGLPIGLNWQCNNYANGCNYDPQANLYGCANVSGTPLIPGNYIAHVTVIATIQIVGDQTVDYPVPIVVFPGQSSNSGFIMTNGSGCAPLTVSFTTVDTGQASYQWDFGDGIQSNLENPPPHVYSVPGDYIVTQTIIPNVVPDYFLTSVTVNSIPDNYGAPLDDPDMYLLIADALSNPVYDSRPAQNGLFPPQTWPLPNIQLSNQDYTIHVWDEDGGLFGADDDLGEITFAGHGASGNATATVSGASGTLNLDYVIFQTPVNPIVTTDTVHVFPSQNVPAISWSGNLNFCEGDSLLLVSSELYNNQWNVDGIPLSGDTNQTYTVIQTGLYSLTVSNEYGCSATAAMVDTIHVYDNPPNPTLFTSGDSIVCALTGYSYQWLLNDTPVTGATNIYFIPAFTGNYSVVVITNQGCTDTSQVLYYVVTGIENNVRVGNFRIFPNPAKDLLYLEGENLKNDEVALEINDIMGKSIHRQHVRVVNYRIREVIPVSFLSPGCYFIRLEAGSWNRTMRFIKH